MKLDIATIECIAAGGIGFSADLRDAFGCRTITLKTDDIQEYLEDPDKFTADLLGFPKHVFLNWLDSEGLPRCGATTKNGSRCKNNVSGGTQRPIDDWFRLDGDYCIIHGGDSSKEAWMKREQKL